MSKLKNLLQIELISDKKFLIGMTVFMGLVMVVLGFGIGVNHDRSVDTAFSQLFVYGCGAGFFVAASALRRDEAWGAALAAWICAALAVPGYIAGRGLMILPILEAFCFAAVAREMTAKGRRAQA